jgi:cell division protein FtsW (lipid II flippase)
VLLAFAAYAIDRKGKPKEGLKVFLPVLVVMSVFVAVILGPDFGMAVVIGASCMAVLSSPDSPGSFWRGSSARGPQGSSS